MLVFVSSRLKTRPFRELDMTQLLLTIRLSKHQQKWIRLMERRKVYVFGGRLMDLNMTNAYRIQSNFTQRVEKLVPRLLWKREGRRELNWQDNPTVSHQAKLQKRNVLGSTKILKRYSGVNWCGDRCFDCLIHSAAFRLQGLVNAPFQFQSRLVMRASFY